MGWSTVRPATAEDEQILAAVDARFRRRHDVDPEAVRSVHADGTLGHGNDLRGIEDRRAFSPEYALKLQRFLRRNTERAIGGEGIAGGYVVDHVE